MSRMSKNSKKIFGSLVVWLFILTSFTTIVSGDTATETPESILIGVAGDEPILTEAIDIIAAHGLHASPLIKDVRFIAVEDLTLETKVDLLLTSKNELQSLDPSKVDLIRTLFQREVPIVVLSDTRVEEPVGTQTIAPDGLLYLINSITDKDAKNYLEKAVDDIKIAENYMLEDKYEESFEHTHKAVNFLEKVNKKGYDVTNIIDILINGVENKIQETIFNAKTRVDANNTHLQKAQEKFDLAIQKLSENNYDAALEQFKNAYKHASKALEDALPEHPEETEAPELVACTLNTLGISDGPMAILDQNIGIYGIRIETPIRDPIFREIFIVVENYEDAVISAGEWSVHDFSVTTTTDGAWQMKRACEWIYSYTKIEVRYGFTSYQLNDNQAGTNWYRLDTNYHTLIKQYIGNSVECGYYVSKKVLKIDVDYYNTAVEMWDYGPTTSTGSTTTGYTIGGGLSGYTPGFDASYSYSWSTPDVSTTSYSSYSDDYAKWVENFAGAGGWWAWPYYTQPCAAARAAFASYPSVIAQLGSNPGRLYFKVDTTTYYKYHTMQWYLFYLVVNTYTYSISPSGSVRIV